MLRNLSIENYALIDSLSIELGEGLTILTGETGAGKSVMMGALALLMGERADSKVLDSREGKAIVEGTFNAVDQRLKKTFDDNDLDWNDATVIVRREITASGRSRAFINDTPVTLPLLSEIAGGMVDIHSQHSNRLLSKPEHQLWIIDSMADNAQLIAEYKKDFARFASLRQKIRKIRESFERSRENRQLRAFQLEQLSKINPRPGELEEVEKAYDILSDADDLRSRISSGAARLSQADSSAEASIAAAIADIEKIDFGMFMKEDEAESGIVQRLRSAYIEIKDISDTLARIASDIESDPLKLAKTDARLKELYEAVKHFRVKDYDALVVFYADLKRDIEGNPEDLAELNRLEEEAKRLGAGLMEKAETLSRSRKEAAVTFAERLMEEARPLGLKNLRFEVRLSQGKLTSDGKDSVEFYCSFNKNQALMPLAQTASGGEMSRLTLTIKAMIAGKMKLPTVIFDEIDTGVSGDIADRMGAMMADIAKDMQVIAITHLPQVAAKGDRHFLVYKEDVGERTVSNVRQLKEQEREREIARMLSGRNISTESLANARSLLAEK